jgi:hypothetical protein
MTDACACRLCRLPIQRELFEAMMECIAGLDVLYLTEESALADFALTDDELAELSRQLGVPVRRTDFVVDVLERIRA